MQDIDHKKGAWRHDAVAKVTGRARFTDDLKVSGMLQYADHVHARLVAVEVDEARRTPGVVRVVTASDAPGSSSFGQIRKDYQILASDRIGYCGEVVALVVGRTRAAAIAGAERVSIHAEELPCVLYPEAAMSPTAPLVHEDHGSNIVNH
jgi:CO/xanthine dehydrogenase Mo-binding subunit